MRLLSVDPTAAITDLPVEAIVCHDVRNPSDRNEILVRKGSPLQAEALSELLARGVIELHLAVAEPGDVAEDEAAARLAATIVGTGASATEARFGQASLVSEARGMVRVDRASLEQINTLDGVLLLTAEADRPVDPDTTLGVVKCAPLFMPQATLEAVERISSANGPILQVLPFESRRVAFVAPTERLRGGAFERARSALSDAIGWYGSSLDQTIGAEATVDGLAAAYHRVRHGGAELILAAGASGTDPLDVVFEGLRRAGGEVLQLGIPAEPGTACWIGRLEEVPVLGLASCELFGQPGALDLLLPRLFSGAALDQHLLRELAYGGLLLGPSRIAPYHTAREG
jgi:molybdenum cofactor cytidylyltransferase